MGADLLHENEMNMQLIRIIDSEMAHIVEVVSYYQ